VFLGVASELEASEPSGGSEKGGRANRPSPQSPKGILGSRPPRSLGCNLNAISKSFVLSILLAKSE
jgi:hypothetical protein